MKIESLIKTVFPNQESAALRGLKLGLHENEVQKKEGEPYDKSGVPKRKTWLYDFDLEGNILIEVTYIFEKKSVLTGIDLYINLPGSNFTSDKVDEIREHFIEFLNQNLGDGEKLVTKTEEGYEYYFTWKTVEEKEKQKIVLIYSKTEPWNLYGDKRTIKFSQSKL